MKKKSGTEEKQKKERTQRSKSESEGSPLLQENFPSVATSGERKKIKSHKAAELRKVLEKYRNKNLVVLIKGSPDPDSIASSWAFSFIAKHFDINCDTVYVDKISHQENKALVKTLEIALIKFSEKFNCSIYDGYVLVDNQSNNIHPGLAPILELPCVGVVDHHKESGEVEAQFMDIRENAGSTSSIFVEYLKYGGFALEPGRQEDTKLATALMHGIRSDTDNFFLAREIDFYAAAYLSAFADSDLLRIISTQLISSKTMDILQRALENKEIQENYLIAGVGFVRSEDRDGIAQAADFLLRREGIDTVVVYGIVDEKYIEGSLRTRSLVLDPDRFLKEILGEDANGNPYGGGRLDKGGFKIPIGMFSNCGNRELLWSLTKTTISEMFYKALGLKEEGTTSSGNKTAPSA